MNTLSESSQDRLAEFGEGDATDHSIQAIIARAKASGLIRAAGEAVKIHKPANGKAIDWAGVKMFAMDVTPDMARAWLTNNFRNRPLSWEVVDAYLRDMLNGQWVQTHQGIAFNDRDELIDGQHRLHAIVKGNLTLTLLITFGLPSGAMPNGMTVMDTVDRGRTRSVADQLRIQHGMKDGSIVAATCSSLGTLCYSRRTKRLTVGQTLDIYNAFSAGVDHVVKHRSKAPGLKAAGVLAAFAFGATAMPDVLRLYKPMIEGREPARSPMHLLYEFLTSEAALLLNRTTDRGLMEVVLNAIHWQLQGREVPALQRTSEGYEAFTAMMPDTVAKVARIFELPG